MPNCLSRNVLYWAVLFIVIGAPMNVKLIWTILSAAVITIMWPVSFQEFILIFFKEKVCMAIPDQSEHVCHEPEAKETNGTALKDVINCNINQQTENFVTASYWKRIEILVLCTALLTSSAVGFLDWQTVIPTWPLPTLVVFTITRLVLYALERHRKLLEVCGTKSQEQKQH